MFIILYILLVNVRRGLEREILAGKLSSSFKLHIIILRTHTHIIEVIFTDHFLDPHRITNTFGWLMSA